METKEIESLFDMIIKGRRLSHKSKASESEQQYQEALNFAQENNLLSEALIPQGAILEIREQFENAMLLFEKAAKDTSNKFQGLAWFYLGSAYSQRYVLHLDDPQAELNYKAIEYFKNSANDVHFKKRHWASNNLANILFRLRKIEDALHYYHLALEPEDFTQYITHYNLGRLSMYSGKHEQAIENFIKAVENAGDDIEMKGCCYREIGTANVYIDWAKKIFKNSIDAWQQAIKYYNQFESDNGKYHRFCGKTAIVMAKIRIAKNFEQDQIDIDDQTLLKWWPPDEGGADGYSTPEERIFSKIESIGVDRYIHYSRKTGSKHSNVAESDILSILRGWGSATPLIEDSSTECRGGGYFLKWRDKGIVIDPGFDFISNFRAAGFHMREIDAVIVSHDHSDHNNDLASIDDVFYEMNRRSNLQDKAESWNYHLFCDERTGSKEFLKHGGKHRTVYPINYNKLSLIDNKEETYNLEQLGLPFRFHFFRAKHAKDFPAFGVRIECINADSNLKSTIGFTCDTEYYEACETDQDSLAQHLQNCNVIIGHISQPTLTELVSPNVIKSNHLGYRGLSKLIRKCRPPITLVGEFWAGFADMRIDICKGLKRISDNALVIPTSIGLSVKPSKGEIECSNCRRWEIANQIHIMASNQEYGPLSYICSNCRLQP